MYRLTGPQINELYSWMKDKGNQAKMLECETDAEAIAVASADIPWLNQNYSSAFGTARRTNKVHTARSYRSELRKESKAKQVAAKKAKEAPVSLEERVSALEAQVSNLYREAGYAVSYNITHQDARSITAVPEFIPDHLRGPQCSTGESQ